MRAEFYGRNGRLWRAVAARRAALLSLMFLSGLAGCSTPLPLPGDPDPPTFSAGLLPTAGDPYNHVASIAALPNGELLVVWGAGMRELATDTRILVSRRTPGPMGTWTAPSVLADQPGRPDANPVLFRDDSDRLHFFRSVMFADNFCQSLVTVQRSDDLGQTWSAERVALPAVCTLLKNRPIILRSGVWLLPAYVEAIYASQFFASLDRGATWFPLAPPLLSAPSNNLQPAVVQLRDGSLLAHARSADGAGFTWESRSCDGVIWLPAPRFDLPNPGSGLDLIRLASGHLVAAYNDNATRRTPLVVARSADDGRTWSPPKTLESGDGAFAYPSLVESDDGLIHCVYSFRYETIKHAVFNRAWLETP